MKELTKDEVLRVAEAAGCGNRIDAIAVERITDPTVWLGHLWNELEKILDEMEANQKGSLRYKNWTHLDFAGRTIFPDATKGCKVTTGIKAKHPCLALAATIEHYKANLDSGK